MPFEGNKELLLRLRESAAEELSELVSHLGEALDVPAARMVLRNPYLTAEIISQLMELKRLLAVYEIRHGLARHPRTPQVHSIRLVATLFWRDLMEMGLNGRVPPQVRRSAERSLVGRVSSLAVGERMAIGRRAGPGVLMRLRFDSDSKVIRALLENPRLNEGLLLPLASHDSAPPEVLKTVAENSRWGTRYPIRVALVRNPRTPPVTALGLVTGLKKTDQRAVAQDQRLATAVRRRARLLLGDPAERADGRR